MPRDANGDYTLPSGNPVVSGSVISSAGWGNPTMDDLGDEISNSLDRDGRGGMRAPFRFVDGDAVSPGISWTAEPSTGLYRAGTGDMRVSVQAVDRFRWAPNAQMWNTADAAWYNVANAKYFTFDGARAVILDDSVERLRTSTLGVDVFGSRIDLDNGASPAAGIRIRHSVGGAHMNVASGGTFNTIQTSGDGVTEKTWMALARDGGVGLNFDDVRKLDTRDYGANTVGQHTVSEAAPIEVNDLTRKDYVDNLISGLQAEIDDIKNGFAFTGAITAPLITEV